MRELGVVASTFIARRCAPYTVATRTALFFLNAHLLREQGWSPGLAFAASASVAVVVDYPVDAAVKYAMALPPEKRVPGILPAVRQLYGAGGMTRLYRGLLPKVCEFAVNYFVIGVASQIVCTFLNDDA